MQINRLFEIVYILLDKKTVTAKELADRFEVSVRTIYRDIDILSSSGIPIYTSQGKGGGISILEEFVLNKSVLTEKEQNEILMSLQSLNAVKFTDVQPVLNKLSTIFNKRNTSWIDVDFSNWGNDNKEQEKFNLLKNAIISSALVKFDYYSSYCEKTERTAEPLKLIFKGQGWYLYAFCKLKNSPRFFKITRIKNLELTDQSFTRKFEDCAYDLSSADSYGDKMIALKLKIHDKMGYRIFDEFGTEEICKNEDDSFTITALRPEGEWLYSYILSFGSLAEVLEPPEMREKIKARLQNILNNYN